MSSVFLPDKENELRIDILMPNHYMICYSYIWKLSEKVPEAGFSDSLICH